MRKPVNNIISIICIFSLIIAILTSCQAGTVKTEKTEYGNVSSQTTEADIPAEDDVVLHVLCRDRYTKYVSMNDYPLIWQEFEKRTGIKVKFEAYPPEDYNTIVGTRIAANVDMPDILTPVGDVLGLYASNVIIDHVPLIEKVGVNAKKHFAKNPDYAASLYTPDGAIPVIYGDITVNYNK